MGSAKKNGLVIVIAVLLLASIGFNIFYYHKYQGAQNKNPDVQTQRIVDDLKKSTSIPNETPSVLTVVDKSKLTDSAIAKNAENGDKILLFQKAGEVIIYRPSTHKLINILSLTSQSSSNQGTTGDTTQKNQPAQSTKTDSPTTPSTKTSGQ
jgi:hypothetical protein